MCSIRYWLEWYIHAILYVFCLYCNRNSRSNIAYLKEISVVACARTSIIFNGLSLCKARHSGIKISQTSRISPSKWRWREKTVHSTFCWKLRGWSVYRKQLNSGEGGHANNALIAWKHICWCC